MTEQDTAQERAGAGRSSLRVCSSQRNGVRAAVNPDGWLRPPTVFARTPTTRRVRGRDLALSGGGRARRQSPRAQRADSTARPVDVAQRRALRSLPRSSYGNLAPERLGQSRRLIVRRFRPCETVCPADWSRSVRPLAAQAASAGHLAGNGAVAPPGTEPQSLILLNARGGPVGPFARMGRSAHGRGSAAGVESE